jgi:hypothetical protein
MDVFDHLNKELDGIADGGPGFQHFDLGSGAALSAQVLRCTSKPPLRCS